jgi:hypothetical protein
MSSSLRIKLLIGAACLIGLYLALSPRESNSEAPTDPRSQDEYALTVQRNRVSHSQVNQLPALAASLMRLSHRVAATATADALFAAQTWYQPPPPAPPAPVAAPVSVKPAPPQAPPLPFTFMGSFTPAGAAPVFFLTQGDRVYDVRVGETLQDIYQVDAFSNGQLLMTYKPLNIQQSLSAGGLP